MMHGTINIKYRLFLSDLNEIWIFSTDFRKKFLRYQISWNSNSSMRTDIRTDWVSDIRTDTTKRIFAFRNYCGRFRKITLAWLSALGLEILKAEPLNNAPIYPEGLASRSHQKASSFLPHSTPQNSEVSVLNTENNFQRRFRKALNTPCYRSESRATITQVISYLFRLIRIWFLLKYFWGNLEIPASLFRILVT